MPAEAAALQATLGGAAAAVATNGTGGANGTLASSTGAHAAAVGDAGPAARTRGVQARARACFGVDCDGGVADSTCCSMV